MLLVHPSIREARPSAGKLPVVVAVLSRGGMHECVRLCMGWAKLHSDKSKLFVLPPRARDVEVQGGGSCIHLFGFAWHPSKRTKQSFGASIGVSPRPFR